MKRNYIVELDIRDIQMLEMYRMGLEQQHPVSEKYEADGHTGLPKCKCCGRIDTDFSLYNEVIDE